MSCIFYFCLDIFSKDIPGDAERLLKIPLGYDQRSENSFTLTNSKTFPSDAFCRLQVTNFEICMVTLAEIPSLR